MKVFIDELQKVLGVGFIDSSSHRGSLHQTDIYRGIKGPKLKYDKQISSKTVLR